MNSRASLRYTIAAGLLCACGILMPQLFHLTFGAAAGQTFLPMHIPVLLAGLLLGPFYGGCVGLVTPGMSCLLFSMPGPLKLPFMTLELAVYGVTAGVFFRLFRRLGSVRIGGSALRLYASLLAAQLCGRAANALAVGFAVGVLGVENNAVSMTAVAASLLAGMPGVILQWLLIPPLAVALLPHLPRK